MNNRIISMAQEAVKRSSTKDIPTFVAGTIADIIKDICPQHPLYIFNPTQVASDTKAFIASFPGKPMYAVKVNTDSVLLKTIYKSGIHCFDVASTDEARLVRKNCPKAEMYYMHPVKSSEAITEAYKELGIRNFVLDHKDELNKIMRATDNAKDLSLFVRIALPKNGSATIDFSSKFGASKEDAIELLKITRRKSLNLGIAFHVGTQTLDPRAYARAISQVATIIRESGITIDTLDVGGGFAVNTYQGEKHAPTVDDCISSLVSALKKEKLDHIPLLAEPGRALVAKGGSLVVRVELRKKDILYINDGTYGGLFDAGKQLNVRFPVQAHRIGKQKMKCGLMPFRFAGPTCDSIDMMDGPFMLPADINEGDYIEIGTLGAYSRDLRSSFNGFGKADTVYIS